MYYLIANVNTGIYLRLDKNGKAETCAKRDAQQFDFKKARNVVSSIPKTMQKFNFSVVEAEKPSLTNPNYELSPAITKWVERVRSCDNLKRDAQKRKGELLHELSNADKELSNLLHTIEIDNWKNACEGYECYKESKYVLEKRRPIKDELIIVKTILDTNISELSEQKIIQIVDGLKERRFEYREIS